MRANINMSKRRTPYDPLSSYFSGDRLYGDDFTSEEIHDWFESESEGYADIGSADRENYKYQYHVLNQKHGFNYCNFNEGEFNALGIGAAYAQEFLPIASKLKSITVLEPSSQMVSSQIAGIIPTYVKPNSDGTIPFSSNSFQLITCFGTLHHIPNVRRVLQEAVRVLAPRGYLLVREPMRTMGDWREPRSGLTKNERGIPHTYFDQFFQETGVDIVKKSFCDSLFLYKILSKFFKVNQDTNLYQSIDSIVSRVLAFNIHYHPTRFLDKVSPGSVFFVVQK